MAEVIRKELGDYMSTQCFHYLRMGAEDTAGRALIVAAGRQRGHSLKDALQNTDGSDAAITKALDSLLGKEGTRLCLVEKVAKNSKGYTVEVRESACSSGLSTSEPNCAFTMGVFLGALELIAKERMTVRETSCVACGAASCVYELESIG
jgi:predicted hydrocarbon binding protein